MFGFVSASPLKRPMRRLGGFAGVSALAAMRWNTPGKVKVRFITQDKTEVVVEGSVGQTVMEVARDVARLDIEAACDGTCACSTCHVYLDEVSYKALPEPDEDELDMLDLAPKTKETSRLSCQIKLTEALSGMTVELPEEQSNQLS